MEYLLAHPEKDQDDLRLNQQAGEADFWITSPSVSNPEEEEMRLVVEVDVAGTNPAMLMVVVQIREQERENTQKHSGDYAHSCSICGKGSCRCPSRIK